MLSTVGNLEVNHKPWSSRAWQLFDFLCNPNIRQMTREFQTKQRQNPGEEMSHPHCVNWGWVSWWSALGLELGRGARKWGKEGIPKGEDEMSKYREKSDSHEPSSENGCALVGETGVWRVSASLLLLHHLPLLLPFLEQRAITHTHMHTHTHTHVHTYTFHFSSEKTSWSLSRIVKY